MEIEIQNTAENQSVLVQIEKQVLALRADQKLMERIRKVKREIGALSIEQFKQKKDVRENN